MASAVTGRGAVYDVRPSGENSFSEQGFIAGLVGFVKDAVQGSCSGLLALIGSSHVGGFAGGYTAIGSELEGLNNVWQGLASSGMAGPVELFAGIIMFLAARRTIARTLGLVAFIGFLVAYANGFSAADMLSALAALLDGAAGALEPIPTAETAA